MESQLWMPALQVPRTDIVSPTTGLPTEYHVRIAEKHMYSFVFTHVLEFSQCGCGEDGELNDPPQYQQKYPLYPPVENHHFLVNL
jgi:hypothetical protein